MMLDIKADYEHRGIRVLRPIGELDAFTVTEFRAAIAQLGSPRELVIDLSAVPFVDSAGLGALIGGVRRTRELGGQVALACSRPTLLRLFHNTGMDRITPVASSVEEAADILRRTDLCAAGSEG
jgi:anti-sigma B factor antagonist